MFIIPVVENFMNAEIYTFNMKILDLLHGLVHHLFVKHLTDFYLLIFVVLPDFLGTSCMAVTSKIGKFVQNYWVCQPCSVPSLWQVHIFYFPACLMCPGFQRCNHLLKAFSLIFL